MKLKRRTDKTRSLRFKLKARLYRQNRKLKRLGVREPDLMAQELNEWKQRRFAPKEPTL